MKVTIIATCKCKDKSIQTLVDEYIKRLKPYFPTKLVEVPQMKGNNAEEIKKAEAAKQLATLPEGAFIIALDEHGAELPTTKLANQVSKWQTSGTSHCAFIIGGAEGLDESVLGRANFTLSLSKLTLPHMLVRPVLLEQIYRVATVLAGHPYHRE